MITLTVISFNDAPHAGALTARFDELGGSIGRADSNQLVLPDPERTISRVAAQVVFRNGAYAIVDRGSNPILLNGKALGSGREALLKAGDKVKIGGYVMQVTAAASAAAPASAGGGGAAVGSIDASDPFAGLLGPAAAAPAAARGVADPLAGLNAGGAASARHAPPPPAPAAAGGIPDNWDPFAPPTNWGNMTASGAKKPSGGLRRAGIGLDTGAAAPPPLMAGLPGLGDLGSAAPKADSLDAMFGLQPGGSGADPLGGSKLAAPIAQPNMAGHADPMRALGSAPKATASAERDALSDLQRPFIPPTTINPPERGPAPPVMPAPVAPPQMIPPTAPGNPASGAVLSWASAPSEASMTVVNAGSMRKQAKTQHAAVPPTAPAAHVVESPVRLISPQQLPGNNASSTVPASARMAPPTERPSVHEQVPRTVPTGRGGSAAAPSAAADHALLAALLSGLELKDSPMTALTPEFMHLVGTLLREAVGGTVDLLVARAAMKRELRAAATTIVARDNNPLKFSPSGEAALQHLMSPPVRGFMPAAEAMRDAYSDLRAHQFAFVAGMQAALEGVLERFDPQKLEGQLSRASVLSSLLPGSRKAKMWDVFVDHYAHIREQASEDFHTLFGKAFLEAYEAQLERLQPHTTQPGVKR